MKDKIFKKNNNLRDSHASYSNFRLSVKLSFARSNAALIKSGFSSSKNGAGVVIGSISSNPSVDVESSSDFQLLKSRPDIWSQVWRKFLNENKNFCKKISPKHRQSYR